MNEEQFGILGLLGVDKEVTMERFMQNEDLYYRCLKKFLTDDNYRKYKESYANRNVKDAFEALHSLKGVTGNLGLDNMYDTVRPMVEILRTGSLDIDSESRDKLDEYYEEAVNIINKL